MANLTLVQAINLALTQEMEADESVVILGEDVGLNGGVFRVTEGGDTAQAVDVETDIRNDTVIQITKGLLEGDRVIISGLSTLSPGDKVHVFREIEPSDTAERRD